jgi:hypothetical protein
MEIEQKSRSLQMVRIKIEGGGYFHEPPYTPEEERDFYRRIGGGPVTVVHRPATGKTEKPKPRKLPPQPPEE